MDANSPAWAAFLKEPSEPHFLPVYDATVALVYTICRRRFRREEDALDAFQDSYARLFAWVKEKPQELAGHSPAYVMRRIAWLESDRLAKKMARQLARRGRSEGTHEEVTMEPATTRRLWEDLGQEQVNGVLKQQVDALPEKYRLAILLHYYDGLTHQEIADTIGASINTVSTRLRRGVQRLAKAMKAAGYQRDVLGLLGLAGGAGLMMPGGVSAAGVFQAASGAS